MPERPRDQRFDELYRTTLADVYSYCIRRVDRRADVDDVVSEVYAVVWRRLDDVLAANVPLAWIYAVAYRTIGNQRRSSARSLRLVNRLSGRRWAGTATPEETVTDNAANDELRGDLEAALAELNPVDAEILRLAVWEELPHAEIAQVVDVDPALVRSRLYRSKQRMERSLQSRDIARDPDTNPPIPRGRSNDDDGAQGGRP